jgi:hypothetical protein
MVPDARHAESSVEWAVETLSTVDRCRHEPPQLVPVLTSRNRIIIDDGTQSASGQMHCKYCRLDPDASLHTQRVPCFPRAAGRLRGRRIRPEAYIHGDTLDLIVSTTAACEESEAPHLLARRDDGFGKSYHA